MQDRETKSHVVASGDGIYHILPDNLQMNLLTWLYFGKNLCITPISEYLISTDSNEKN